MIKNMNAEPIADFYEAEQNDNGTWNVFGVPFFAEQTIQLSDEKNFKIDDAWLNKAKKKFEKRLAEDYLPPLHVQHHPDYNAEYAGKWRYSHNRKAIYDGKPTTVAFCDFLDVPEAKFQQMLNGELDYRSVEILDVNDHEIDSLALLSHEVPFYRFPLLSKRLDPDQISKARKFEPEDIPAVAARAVADGVNSLFCFARGAEMKFQDEERTEEMPEGETPEDENADAAKAILSGIEDLKGMISQLIETLGGETEENEEDEEMQEAASEQSEESPAVELSEKETEEEALKLNASPELLAEIRATKSDVRKMKEERKIESAILCARKDLSAYGLDTDETESELEKVAESHGVKGIELYCNAIKKHMKPDPPAEWSGELDHVNTDDPIVAKFSKHGTKALNFAFKAGKEYEDLRNHYSIGVDKETYIHDRLTEENLIKS